MREESLVSTLQGSFACGCKSPRFSLAFHSMPEDHPFQSVVAVVDVVVVYDANIKNKIELASAALISFA